MRGSKHPPAVTVFERLPEEAVAALRAAVAGPVVTPSDDGYDHARRLWNGLVNRYPAVVVECTGVADVVAAVRFAGDHDLPVSVRAGGHNVSGSALAEAGLVVDVSGLKGVRVDPTARRVRVDPGVSLGELTRETQQFGLAVPGGMAADTGVAGSTLGGGVGWLRGKYGLGVDNLRSVDLVTADGEFLTASEASHPDLFWAVRGGGGNLGVVTSFEFDCHPVGPEVATVMTYYAGEDAAAVLRSYREYVADAPDAVTTLAFHTDAPDSSDVPESARRRPALGVMACYAGPTDEGERALRPLRELADPLRDDSGVWSVLDLHHTEGVYPHGRNYYWKSLYIDDLTDDCIERLVAHGERSPSHYSSLTLWPFRGAMCRVDPTATAFAGRGADHMLTVEASWDDAAASPENVAWAREVWTDMHAFSSGGLYGNFPGFGEEGADLVRSMYGPNYERLAAVKAEYDPDGRFSAGPATLSA